MVDAQLISDPIEISATVAGITLTVPGAAGDPEGAFAALHDLLAVAEDSLYFTDLAAIAERVHNKQRPVARRARDQVKRNEAAARPAPETPLDQIERARSEADDDLIVIGHEWRRPEKWRSEE